MAHDKKVLLEVGLTLESTNSLPLPNARGYMKSAGGPYLFIHQGDRVWVFDLGGLSEGKSGCLSVGSSGKANVSLPGLGWELMEGRLEHRDGVWFWKGEEETGVEILSCHPFLIGSMTAEIVEAGVLLAKVLKALFAKDNEDAANKDSLLYLSRLAGLMSREEFRKSFRGYFLLPFTRASTRGRNVQNGVFCLDRSEIRFFILDDCRRRHVLGRSSICDIPIDSDSISRAHLGFVWDEEGAWLGEDLGSTNGTVLNGIALDEPIRVPDNSLFHLGGKCLMSFVSADSLGTLLRALRKAVT